MKKGNVSNLDTFPFFVLYDGDLCLHCFFVFQVLHDIAWLAPKQAANCLYVLP